jgi:hypothetical protein
MIVNSEGEDKEGIGTEQWFEIELEGLMTNPQILEQVHNNSICSVIQFSADSSKFSYVKFQSSSFFPQEHFALIQDKLST